MDNHTYTFSKKGIGKAQCHVCYAIVPRDVFNLKMHAHFHLKREELPLVTLGGTTKSITIVRDNELVSHCTAWSRPVDYSY